MKLQIAIVMSCVTIQCGYASAGVAGNAVKAVGRNLLGEAAEVAGKKAAKQLAVEAAEKTAREAAESALKRTAKSAATHFGYASARVPQFADDLAKATAKMTGRNQRRLLMLAPKLNESGQAAQVMSHLATRNADELIETLWKHREKLGAAAVVTGLLVHGDDIVEAGGEFVVKPLIDGTLDHVVAPASRLLVSGIVLTVAVGLVALAAYLFGGQATDRVMGRVRGLAQFFGRQW